MDFGKEIRAALVSQLGEERFELWFSDVAIDHVDGAVRVTARTPFTLDRLKKDFSPILQSVAQQVGLDATVRYLVDADLVANQIAEQPPASSSPAPAPAAVANTDVRIHNGENPPASPKSKLIRAASRPARGRRFRNLDAFVDGSCNQLARTSAEMVFDQPGEINPLVIHGPTGVGKTHLMEAIWCKAKKQRRARVVYLSAEQFTTYFVDALRGDGLPNFRRKYRQADVLIIDDIQFFEGKQATLVELAYTIDELSREGRQLVLTADRPPAQLASSVGRDIANRLCGGLVCAMKSVDQATMETISRRWAIDRHLHFDEEIHAMIASRMQGDVRQLSGVLNRLRAASMAMQEPVTMRMANEVLYELVPVQSRVIRLKDVHKAVCEMFGLESDSLHQKSRSKAITQPRMLAMYLSKKHTASGLHEISQFYGRRSHSSAVTAHNSVNGWLTQAKTIAMNGQECDVRDIVSQLEQQLRAG